MYRGIPNTLTYHGLRYNYIQDRMHQEITRGLNNVQAATIVTREVGHERIEVLNVYLGGKNDG